MMEATPLEWWLRPVSTQERVGEQVAGGAQAWILSLGRKSLIDGIQDKPHINQAPDRKDVAGRHKVDLKPGRDFAGGLTVQRQGIG
jgi:hypothetical protein